MPEHTWLGKQANSGYWYAHSSFSWEEGRWSHHLRLFSMFWYFWYTNIPLTCYLISRQLCWASIDVHVNSGFRAEKMHGGMLLTFYPQLQIYSSFQFEHEHSHLLKAVLGIRRTVFKTSWTSWLIRVLWSQWLGKLEFWGQKCFEVLGSLMWKQP